MGAHRVFQIRKWRRRFETGAATANADRVWTRTEFPETRNESTLHKLATHGRRSPGGLYCARGSDKAGSRHVVTCSKSAPRKSARYFLLAKVIVVAAQVSPPPLPTAPALHHGRLCIFPLRDEP